LATGFNAFEKGADFRAIVEPLLGTGVFAADGKFWFPSHTLTDTDSTS
jgi:hypothetical protein